MFGTVLAAIIITGLNFLALVLVEARALLPQGWLLIGVVRHVLSWPILGEMLAVQFSFTQCVIWLALAVRYSRSQPD
jgi:hypothetical protein